MNRPLQKIITVPAYRGLNIMEETGRPYQEGIDLWEFSLWQKFFLISLALNCLILKILKPKIHMH